MLRTEMSRPCRLSRPNSFKLLGLFILGLAVGGCVSGGEQSGATASPVVTGSIPVPPAEPNGVSDRDIVRAAVSTSPAEDAGSVGIPWANAATGTTGVISRISETDVAGQPCRSFQTSRHSYHGIALYVGTACRSPAGAWRLIEFRPKRGADAPGGADGAPTS